jgi:tRNA(adenine34) deaminase
MRMALKEARLAAAENEVPVGAVAVLDGKLLARDHNRSLQLSDPTAHAEILVLRAAGKALGNYRLNGVDLFVTVEPCPMCAGSLIWARISRLVFGTADEKGGGVVSKLDLLNPGRFNHSVEVVSGVCAEEARGILQHFFAARR